MPHLTLELTANVIEKNKLTDLFKQCHEQIAQILPCNIHDCKSRVVVCEQFLIGEGNTPKGFVQVTLKIKSGRTPETLNALGEKLMEIFMDYFAASRQKFPLEISLEINELAPSYFKIA